MRRRIEAVAGVVTGAGLGLLLEDEDMVACGVEFTILLWEGRLLMRIG